MHTRLSIMDRFPPVEYSFQFPVSHFMPCDQHTSSPAGAQAPSQHSFDPLAGSSQAAVGNSSLRSAQAFPSRTARNSDNISTGRSPSFPINPGPSVPSAHGTPRSYDVGIVPGSHSILAQHQQQQPHISPYYTTSTPTHGQTTTASRQPEHVVSWYLTCWEAIVIDGPRQFIPQSIYEPHAEGDKERYVRLAKLQPRIIFRAQDSLEWGIPVQHLLSRKVTRLVEGSEPAFAWCGPTIGIRMQWPGYPPYHKQVSTRDYTPERRTINKAKLAKVVAGFVEQFMKTASGQAMQFGSDSRWKVGPSDITPNDIILVSLHHVSQGSWQPQLRLRRTIGNSVAAGPQVHRRS